jgi:tyrosyl-tRNA synthetase
MLDLKDLKRYKDFLIREKLMKSIFSKNKKVEPIDDSKKEELCRGVQEFLPSTDFLFKQLNEGRKLRIYTGIDPTGPTLHLGHMIVLKKLRDFQNLGHEVILLMGDFTAMIGDPTDKLAVRKVLTEKEVKNNLKLYKKQAEFFLNFSGKNPAKVLFNSTWLKKLNLKDILDLTSLVTVDQMLKRDMFSRRMEDNKPIYMHEFMYPLLQGYDSVAMNVDVEIGGNDQLFNMMMGRDLQKKLNNKEKTSITMKLLADTSGKKMGKTEGNMVSLLDSNIDMFGKVMSWTDDMVLNGFELCTNVSDASLVEIKKQFNEGLSNPRDFKLMLAKEIVKIYHGEEKARLAEENFINTFSKGEIPENIQEIGVPAGTPLGIILQNEKIVASAGEFKRLVKEGAVNTTEGEKIEDFNYLVSKPIIVKVGKRRFLDIKILM